MNKKMCRKSLLAIAVAFAVIFSLTRVSHAALLGVQPQFPVITYDNQGTLSYDASTQILSVNASPVLIRLAPTDPPRLILPASGSRQVTIYAVIDHSGNLISGVEGHDLVIEGEIDQNGDGIIDFSGVLLTGEIAQYGSNDTGGPTDQFDFRFQLTGGLMAGLYIGKDIGLFLQTENSSFGNDFSVNFGGGAKGIEGPIDSLCAISAFVEGCVVIPPPPTVISECDGKLTQLTLTYTGQGCDATSHTQDAKKVNCIGNAAFAEPVSILVSDKKGKKIWASQDNIFIGDTVLVDAANASGKKKHDRHHKSHEEKLKSTTKVTLFDANGDTIEEVLFHTSCSQPLNTGDQFGSMRISAMVSTKGGVVTEQIPEPTPEPVCVTELPILAPPHCIGKVEALQLRYTGGGCTASNNTQDPTKATCTGDASSLAPVRIRITDENGSLVYLDTGSANVVLGDVVTATAVNAGAIEFKASTQVQILDAGGVVLENIIFHTSCSQPLNLGDRFGSLEIFGMDTTNGPIVAAAQDVVYTYTITNNNSVYPLSNVTVVDDCFGVVPGSPIASIPSLGSVTLTLTGSVSEEKTNTATVTGYVGVAACTAMAETTITKAAPPVEPVGGEACTRKIKSMLLKYTGPDILGATVEVVAKTFEKTPVVYTGVDLTAGTVLSSPLENGFLIDAIEHDKTDLGSKVKIFINGVEEELHTSCSTPFVSGLPVPLNIPKGAPSPNWEVISFTQKDHHSSDDDNDRGDGRS